MSQANRAEAPLPATDATTAPALSVAPAWLQPLRWAAVLAVVAYYHTAYRVRGWGTLPRRRGPALIVANHQHDMESAVIVASLSVQTMSARYPIFTASSRRMWEPGFMAERISWLRFALRMSNMGWLFASLGMQPVENELHSRPFASMADWLLQHYGDLPLDGVFRESALARLPAGVKKPSDILNPRYFEPMRARLTLSELREPYRGAALAATREQLDADLAHFVRLVDEGATIFLTPEGFYTGDGKMQRLRGLLGALRAHAKIWLAGVSYDVFAGRRFSMLYKVAAARDGVALEPQLKACRPVTVSALLATWLYRRTEPFTEAQALEATRSQLAALPRCLFADPELQAKPRTIVRGALDGMCRLRILRREGERYALAPQRVHPQFPRTRDIIEYQRNFHAETLEGASATS